MSTKHNNAYLAKRRDRSIKEARDALNKVRDDVDAALIELANGERGEPWLSDRLKYACDNAPRASALAAVAMERIDDCAVLSINSSMESSGILKPNRYFEWICPECGSTCLGPVLQGGYGPKCPNEDRRMVLKKGGDDAR